MGRLTEYEILDQLKTSLATARDGAERLARGERGKIYQQFRESLELVYGCTRQISGWREDARWLKFGVDVQKCREMCRRWLVDKHGPKAFRLLADILKAAQARALELETKRTGRRGMILPETPAYEKPAIGRGHGLILPPGYEKSA